MENHGIGETFSIGVEMKPLKTMITAVTCQQSWTQETSGELVSEMAEFPGFNDDVYKTPWTLT